MGRIGGPNCFNFLDRLPSVFALVPTEGPIGRQHRTTDDGVVLLDDRLVARPRERVPLQNTSNHSKLHFVCAGDHVHSIAGPQEHSVCEPRSAQGLQEERVCPIDILIVRRGDVHVPHCEGMIVRWKAELHHMFAESVEVGGSSVRQEGRQLQKLVGVFQIGQIEDHGAIEGTCDLQRECRSDRGGRHGERSILRVVAPLFSGLRKVFGSLLGVRQNGLGNFVTRHVRVGQPEMSAGRGFVHGRQGER